MGKKGLLSFFMLVFLLAQSSSAWGALTPMRVIRWSRPNVFVGQVLTDGEGQRVRVRLAGIMPTLGNDRIYEQAWQYVRQSTKGKTVMFDFALGHGPEENTWVGYLYIPSQDDEEPVLLNAELLRGGLAVLDEKEVGRNLLGYFMEAQAEAQDRQMGIWTVTAPEPGRKSKDECPSCEIR